MVNVRNQNSRFRLVSFSALIGLLAAAISPISTAQATPSDPDLAWIGTTATAVNMSVLGLRGGSQSVTTVSAAVSSSDIGPAITSDSNNLYFVKAGALVAADASGAIISTLIADLSALASPLTHIQALAVDSTNIYILDSVAGVWKKALGSGLPTRFDSAPYATSLPWPGGAGNGIAEVGSSLYWVEADGVHTKPLIGGSESVFASNSVAFASSANANKLAVSLNANGQVLVVSTANGSSYGDFWVYDFAASSPSWQQVLLDGTFQDPNITSGWPYFGANYAFGLVYSNGWIYFTDAGGGLAKIQTASGGSNEAILYRDPNMNWSLGLAVWPSVALKTVTFNANNGSGTMSNQTGVSSQNLTSGSFTRTGYTFAGWNTQANGSGSSFTDGGTYNFSNTITLYAQWTLIPVPANSAPTYPQLTSVSTRSFTEGDPQLLTLEGQRFDFFVSATVNGESVKTVTSENGSVTLDLGDLKPGTYTLVLKFKAGSLIYQDAITVKAKSAIKTDSSRSVAKKLIAGFAGDSAVLTAAIKAQTLKLLKSIAAPTAIVCTGSTSNNKISANDRALARSRAVAICAFAKSQVASLSTRVQLNPSSGVGANARNVLLEVTN